MVRTLTLPAGQTLTITADSLSSGTVRRITDSPGDGTLYDSAAIAADSTTSVGPFPTERRYEVISETGLLACASATADIAPTGTGAQVLAGSPSLESPTAAAAIVTPAVTTVSGNGALSIASGIVKITKSASAASLTLAAPSAGQEGTIMQIVSTTAKAHTITATGLINDGVTGGAKDEAAFAAFIGASITLVAIAQKWTVLALNAVTVS